VSAKYKSAEFAAAADAIHSVHTDDLVELRAAIGDELEARARIRQVLREHLDEQTR
jgi:hypothetical protein